MLGLGLGFGLSLGLGLGLGIGLGLGLGLGLRVRFRLNIHTPQYKFILFGTNYKFQIISSSFTPIINFIKIIKVSKLYNRY